MIQTIGENRYNNQYKKEKPQPEDFVLSYRGREFLTRVQENQLLFLTYEEVSQAMPEEAKQYTYLFRIDDKKYFLINGLDETKFPGCKWENVVIFRNIGPKEAAFASITGAQLADWYQSRQYCPRCGKKMVHDEEERMMRCPSCKLMEFPKLSPAVIVAVTNEDRILMTRYAGRAGNPNSYALIAGFAEIGETLEETVQREVMEEVGLKVKNIRYYNSQPWSLTSTLLVGYFCDLDGSDEIIMDQKELSLAGWFSREEVPEDDDISLTRQMMQVFKDGREKNY